MLETLINNVTLPSTKLIINKKNYSMELIAIFCILFVALFIGLIVFYNQTITKIRNKQIAKEKQIEEKNLLNWHIFLSSLEAPEQKNIHQLVTKKNKDVIRAQQILRTRDFSATEEINWAYLQLKESYLWEFLSKFNN